MIYLQIIDALHDRVSKMGYAKVEKELSETSFCVFSKRHLLIEGCAQIQHILHF